MAFVKELSECKGTHIWHAILAIFDSRNVLGSAINRRISTKSHELAVLMEVCASRNDFK